MREEITYVKASVIGWNHAQELMENVPWYMGTSVLKLEQFAMPETCEN